VWERVFRRPGFHRLGLTVDNGVLADLAWRDLLVVAPVAHELGTEGESIRWGFELEGNAEGRGRVWFADDPDAVVGRSALRFTPNPYPGLYVTAIYPADRQAQWDFSHARAVRFWIKTRNPNLPGFQNAGPVLRLYTAAGTLQLEPVKKGNLFGRLPYSEARWTWLYVEAPLAGDAQWERSVQGRPDLTHTRAISLSLDSWGGDPFIVWLDGLSVE